jgi:hypothetical protein
MEIWILILLLINLFLHIALTSKIFNNKFRNSISIILKIFTFWIILAATA